MKKIFRLIVFILIFILIFDRLTLLLVRKGNSYGTDVLNFYHQDKSSIDILYMGSSHAYSAFNPYIIEEETGLNGYVFATQQQPIWITYYFLKEALKYQQPKYIMLEVHMAVVGDNDYAEEQVNRDALDKMRMSLNKIEAINYSVPKEERIYYYFNIMKYHSRYKELDDIDYKTIFLNYSIDNKGYIALNETDYIFDKNNIQNTDVINKISDKNLSYLNKIIEITNKHNIKLILVKTPAVYDKDKYEKLNYITKYSSDLDLLFLNYIKDIDKLNLNATDFYDSGHLNKNGSEQFSKEISQELNKIENSNEKNGGIKND